MQQEQTNPADNAAVQEAASGVVEHQLQAPYQFEGVTHTSVTLNLRDLTGKDLAEIHAQWTALGYFAMQPETDSDFCILVAARACKQVPEFFECMPAPEYIAIETVVKVFLQADNIAKAAGATAAAPLSMQLDSLTGRDLSQIKREWVAKGGVAGFPATDLNYCALVAARAAGVTLDKVQALPAPQYIRVLREVGDFLQG